MNEKKIPSHVPIEQCMGKHKKTRITNIFHRTSFSAILVQFQLSLFLCSFGHLSSWCVFSFSLHCYWNFTCFKEILSSFVRSYLEWYLLKLIQSIPWISPCITQCTSTREWWKKNQIAKNNGIYSYTRVSTTYKNISVFLIHKEAWKENEQQQKKHSHRHSEFDVSESEQVMYSQHIICAWNQVVGYT